MRLIDADELIRIYFDDGIGKNTFNFVPSEFIDSAPTVDAVEVVRCKDCKYSVDYYQDGNCYCRRPNNSMAWIEKGFNWFCADGEREENG